MALNQVTVANPATVNSADSATVTALAGKAGDVLLSSLHGKWYTSNYRGNLFTYNVTGVTLPVVANNLVSKFAVYNPPQSGRNMELVCLDIGIVLNTTVVDTLGIYYSSGALAAASTFTTAGTALSGFVGGSASNVCIPYSALTHSGTPTRHSIVGYFGAITTVNGLPAHIEFDGRVIVPPGVVISVATSTTAWTGSGLDLSITWAEVPV